MPRGEGGRKWGMARTAQSELGWGGAGGNPARCRAARGATPVHMDTPSASGCVASTTGGAAGGGGAGAWIRSGEPPPCAPPPLCAAAELACGVRWGDPGGAAAPPPLPDDRALTAACASASASGWPGRRVCSDLGQTAQGSKRVCVLVRERGRERAEWRAGGTGRTYTAGPPTKGMRRTTRCRDASHTSTPPPWRVIATRHSTARETGGVVASRDHPRRGGLAPSERARRTGTRAQAGTSLCMAQCGPLLRAASRLGCAVLPSRRRGTGAHRAGSTPGEIAPRARSHTPTRPPAVPTTREAPTRHALVMALSSPSSSCCFSCCFCAAARGPPRLEGAGPRTGDTASTLSARSHVTTLQPDPPSSPPSPPLASGRSGPTAYTTPVDGSAQQPARRLKRGSRASRVSSAPSEPGVPVCAVSSSLPPTACTRKAAPARRGAPSSWSAAAVVDARGWLRTRTTGVAAAPSPSGGAWAWRASTAAQPALSRRQTGAASPGLSAIEAACLSQAVSSWTRWSGGTADAARSPPAGAVAIHESRSLGGTRSENSTSTPSAAELGPMPSPRGAGRMERATSGHMALAAARADLIGTRSPKSGSESLPSAVGAW